MRINSAGLAVALALGACNRARPPAAPVSVAAPPATGVDPDEVRPVYSGKVTPDARAQNLCDLLYTVPTERQAACCGTKPVPTVTGECVRIVSLALSGGQVTLDEAKLPACDAAIRAQFATCDRAGNLAQPIPAACQGLFSGKLAAGAVCHSALECEAGLTCAGIGPTDPGKCAPASGPGTPCHPIVDPLAVFAQQSLEGHEICAGYCNRNRCADLVPAGGPCTFADQCGPGNHCADLHCAPGSGSALGARCIPGACAAGAGCVDGVCIARAGVGAACASAEACLADCTEGDGGSHCGPRCPQPFRLTPPVKTKRPSL